MKKIAIIFLILGLVMTSCDNKEEASEQPAIEKEMVVDINGAIEGEKPPVPFYEPSAEYTPKNTVPTYWYVTFEEVQRDKDGKRTGSIDWHRAMKLNTPYFDFVEARKDFPAECTGKCYFDFVVQISRESYESWKDFKRIYH